MAFLAPLFLIGALAIGAPILFHLIRRHTREVVPFSSLMFLRPTPPRVHRRSRLENFWLLLLRCLALLLLALCFARPFINRQDALGGNPEVATRTVVLLDTSASMQRPGLWDAALARVREITKQGSSGSFLSLLAFDRSPRTISTFDEWSRTTEHERAALVESRLETLKPGYASTSLGSALLAALELLEETPPGPTLVREIVVVSDLQDGSRLDGLQGRTWPADIKVRLEKIDAPEQVNAAAHWVTGNSDVEPALADEKLLLRVSNSAGSTREQFKLQRQDGNGAAIPLADAYVPTGQTRTIRLPALDPKQPESGAITVSGDDVPFDNQLFVLPRQVARIPVIFIGNEAAEAPEKSVFYLERALATMRRAEIALEVKPGEAAPEKSALMDSELMVLGDGVTTEVVGAARSFAEAGHIVLFPLTSVGSGGVLTPLLGVEVPVTEAKVQNYALLSHVEFQHPFFASFADPRFSDFTKIHFWKYRKMDLSKVQNARVLAKFDSGNPALVQVPLGRGSVVLMAASWRPVDSQLALSTKFVPLLNAILEQSSRLPESRMQYFVGDEVQVSTDTAEVTVRKPDGSEVRNPGERFAGTDQPGIYTLEPKRTRFAVNLNPEESRIAPMPVDRLTSLGVPVLDATRAADAAAKAGDPKVQAVELESRQKLWRWLLAAAFAILLVETWLAGRLARHSTAPAH